jgi:hypothetical protein
MEHVLYSTVSEKNSMIEKYMFSIIGTVRYGHIFMFLKVLYIVLYMPFITNHQNVDTNTNMPPGIFLTTVI